MTPALANHVAENRVEAASALRVDTYRDLVQRIAQLAFYNKDHLLFFRGQSQDFRSKGGSSTFYPSIYRGESLSSDELAIRFEILEDASRQLKQLFDSSQFEGRNEVARKRYIRWSILQHYEVCATPLLDFTHSIRVACSFAQHGNSQEQAYVFVFGLPYITNRISINSEDDLVNIRLLSICPPEAVRPYFQDGYLAGTEDITNEYESKTELDFNNRLIAKFEIPNDSSFWGRGLTRLPKGVLYPPSDQVKELCDKIRPSPAKETGPAELGTFLAEWNELEGLVTGTAREFDMNARSVGQALRVLQSRGFIDKSMADELHKLRRFRNQLVHGQTFFDGTIISKWQRRVVRARSAIF